MTTVLGFDFGPRKIGVAVGQTVTGSAGPLVTLRSRGGKPDWDGIRALVDEWGPGALVVGLPFNMDDSEVGWSPQVHRFARQLHGRFGIAVHLVDERLTSIEARRRIRDRPAGRCTGRNDVDAVAAALILETWLGEQR